LYKNIEILSLFFKITFILEYTFTFIEIIFKPGSKNCS